ncbi:ABC transporter substrate-binding protein [Gracilibacillus alcaliphilus]|uniref:ABC transporter substrate-binding protein n=1 Tax=Gracilibacillus alcaliphilus TaxID=1401441 RepID=UPI00195AF146|nr:ABC transporter substrate-binding protein [Gracilibacillus alcaliphilus]MBM7679451.1 iron complex transport system substrate-binding protein [Gracilibacillus alcaliphilus]
MKKYLLLMVVFTFAAALAACGDQAQESTSSEEKDETTETEETYPVTIANYTKSEGGASWEAKDQIFEKTPERVMANTRPAAELLLRLGLKDHITGVGASFGAPDPIVEEEYNDLDILSDGYVSKEVTLGTDPDLVFGRGGLFENEEWGVGTVDSLNEMGINTYVLASSVTGATYDSIYEDIENIGAIFDVQDKAEEFAAQLKEQEESIIENLSTIEGNRTFAYLHTTDASEISVYGGSGESFFNDVFSKVKLDNVFKDETGEISIEMLIEADPDVLILPTWVDNDPENAEKVREEIYKNPKLSSMKAIQDKQIYIVDYNYMFGYSYNALDGMEILAKDMYPQLFE